MKLISLEKYLLFSPVFLLPKYDGFFRMILNLRRLNESILYSHFNTDASLISFLQDQTALCPQRIYRLFITVFTFLHLIRNI